MRIGLIWGPRLSRSCPSRLLPYQACVRRSRSCQRLHDFWLGPGRRVSPEIKRKRLAPTAAAGQAAGTQQTSTDLWLIVGLGNPGPTYHKTRHNVGFSVVEAIAQHANVSIDKQQHKSQVARALLWGKRALLAKPTTFMNNSGQSVVKLVQYYKVPHSQLLVIYDDLDLDPGAVRLRSKGGHGGHNGMRSIIQHLGGQSDFARLRIGIGRPARKEQVADYVLQAFSKQQQVDIEAAQVDAVDIVHSIFSLGLEKAMSGMRAAT